MGTEQIVGLARALSRGDFARRVTSRFLVMVDSGEDEQPISFETVEASTAMQAMDAARPTIEFHEIAKAPGNPYPDRISIGRARNCDILLRYSSVSKLHAHLRPRDDGELDMVDLGSQNGTRVNGRVLEPNRPLLVPAGAMIQVGRVITRLCDAGSIWDLIRA